MILVVDDDDQELRLVQRVLGRVGLDASTVGDGPGALELLDKTIPDLVILDVGLPGMSGLDVLDQIRARPELAGMPVILLTGQSGSADVVTGLSRGAHDYLAKPFAPAELVARARAALRTGELIRRLERRSLELDRFAMTAAHDLKSPLSAIRGTASILERRWDRLDDTQRAELFALISASAERSTRMIEDLLTLARFDQAPGSAGGGVTADPERVAAEVVEAVPRKPGDEVRIDGSWAAVAAEEADLRAAVANLYGNAVTYGRSADGTLRARIEGGIEGGTLVIEITDAGPGIPEEEREKIFDPFYGGQGSRQINPESTGIGLAIVKRAAERWRGTVECLPGNPGTKFRLVVPTATPG